MKYLSALEKQPHIAVFFQRDRRLRCLGWPSSMRLNFRFTGLFTSDASNTEGNPSILIPFLSNRLEPMCPIENAYEMGKGFPGGGHCALINGAQGPYTIEQACEEIPSRWSPHCTRYGLQCVRWIVCGPQ